MRKNVSARRSPSVTSRRRSELFADDFFDHTPQPGGTRDKAGVLALYKRLREAFPDFTPEIHWQRVDGDVVTTFKTYHGTHRGNFLGIAGTGTKVSFETVDAMRVVNGKITEHWGVANLYLLGPAAVGRDRATAADLKRWTPMNSLIALIAGSLLAVQASAAPAANEPKQIASQT
jgi:predicted ester cyclase